MRIQYHFYLNDNKVQDIELIRKLDKEANISSLVKRLLTQHFQLTENVREKYKDMREVV